MAQEPRSEGTVLIKSLQFTNGGHYSHYATHWREIVLALKGREEGR